MKRILTTVAFASALSFVFGAMHLLDAQQPSPEVQALQAKLMQELNASLQCTAQAITLGQENAKLKVEIEELRKAKEPPK